MQIFRIKNWRMENIDDDVRRLVISCPKLRSLILEPLNQTSISLSTLKTIAENCPELRALRTPMDTSTIPPFDTTSSKSVRHNLELLAVWSGRPPTQTTLEFQIQMTRHLDFILPNLKSLTVDPEDATWSGIRDLLKLCQDARRV